MRRIWFVAALVCLVITASCGSAPDEVIVGAEAEAGKAGGEAWIDPRDAAIERAGGRWSDDDFDLALPAVATYSAPVEVDFLSDEELLGCDLLDDASWPPNPADVEVSAAAGDGTELEHHVLDRGSQSEAIFDAFDDYAERCPVWSFVDGVTQIEVAVRPLDMDLETVTFSLTVNLEGEPWTGWFSIARRENVLSLISFIAPSSELGGEDEAEFKRLVDLQVEALTTAPVSQIDGRVPDDSPRDAAGDAADEPVHPADTAVDAAGEADEDAPD